MSGRTIRKVPSLANKQPRQNSAGLFVCRCLLKPHSMSSLFCYSLGQNRHRLGFGDRCGVIGRAVFITGAGQNVVVTEHHVVGLFGHVQIGSVKVDVYRVARLAVAAPILRHWVR